MITRAIYSHYSRPMLENKLGKAIGWYKEKYFWVALALSVHFSRKWFKEVVFYCDEYAKEKVSAFDIPFDHCNSVVFSSLDLPASLWSIPKIYAIDYEIAMRKSPFLHLDGDVFLTKPLPEKYLMADVIVQNHEPLSCYHFYERGWKMFLKGGFTLTEEFLYGYAKKIAPVNNGIVGGNNLELFKKYCAGVLEMVEMNKGRFEDKPIPEYCVTLEQWLLSVFCERNKVPITVLLTDLKRDPVSLGYKHYLAHTKRSRVRCENMERTAQSIIPDQLELINEHFEKSKVLA